MVKYLKITVSLASLFVFSLLPTIISLDRREVLHLSLNSFHRNHLEVFNEAVLLSWRHQLFVGAKSLYISLKDGGVLSESWIYRKSKNRWTEVDQLYDSSSVSEFRLLFLSRLWCKTQRVDVFTSFLVLRLRYLDDEDNWLYLKNNEERGFQELV